MFQTVVLGILSKLVSYDHRKVAEKIILFEKCLNSKGVEVGSVTGRSWAQNAALRRGEVKLKAALMPT